MAKEKSIKAGLLGVGLNTYWNQFDGLFSRLTGYQEEIEKRMRGFCAEVVNVGIVDSTQRAEMVIKKIKTEDIDLLFVFISTYALSATLLPIVQQVKTPVILLNIQPSDAIDYNHVNQLGDRVKMTGEWLAYCQACSVPEIAYVCNKSGIRYDIVTGHLQDDEAWLEIKNWVEAACVVKGMKNNRLGILGHYYNGMIDIYSDLIKQTSVFGTQMEMLEMCELKSYWEKASENDISNKVQEFYDCFDVVPQCSQSELIRAGRTSVALDKLVNEHQLGALAYYYESTSGSTYENIITSVIAGNTLLTGKGIPVAGECEVKNVQAMKILSLLKAGGSFAEFYALDFKDDVVLLGHDGPAHFLMSECKVKLVPLPVYHGKPGAGLSIQMSVKQGPVTLLAVCEGEKGIFFLIAEGEAVCGPVLQIGNTNSRYRFSCGIKSFVDRWSKAGPSHHCAIGVGHLANKLKKIAFLLGIQVVEIK